MTLSLYLLYIIPVSMLFSTVKGQKLGKDIVANFLFNLYLYVSFCIFVSI